MSLISINESTHLIESRLDEPPTVWEARKARFKKYHMAIAILGGGIAIGVVTNLIFFTAKKLTPHSDHKTINKISDVYLYVLLGFGVAACCLVIASTALLRYRNPLYFSNTAQAIESFKSVKNKEATLPIIHAIMKKWENVEHYEAWKRRKLAKNPDLDLAETLWKRLHGGQCAGHAHALLTLMTSYSDYSSESLLELVKFERIVYLQLLSNLLVRNWRHQESTDACVPFSLTGKEKLAVYTTALYCLRTRDSLAPYGMIGSRDIDISEGKEAIKASFEQIYTHLPQDVTIAGEIALLGHESAHALFLQCDQVHRKFRFYDAGSRLSGFYEFKSSSDLFDALVIHVKTWEKFADGKILFILHAIPLPGSQPALSVDAIV